MAAKTPLKMIKYETIMHPPRVEFFATSLLSVCRWWIESNVNCPCKQSSSIAAFAYYGAELIIAHANPDCIRRTIHKSAGIWGVARLKDKPFTIQWRMREKETSDPEKIIKLCLAHRGDYNESDEEDDDDKYRGTRVIADVFVDMLLLATVNALKRKMPGMVCDMCKVSMDRICFSETVWGTVQPNHLNMKCIEDASPVFRTFVFAYAPASDKSAIIFLEDGPIYACGRRMPDIVATLQEKLAGPDNEKSAEPDE